MQEDVKKKITEVIKVRIASDDNTKLIEKLLLESVTSQKGVLKTPKPSVLFEDLGVSILYFYIADSFSASRIKSKIRFTIDNFFRENNITIPFPQRDVYLFEAKKTEGSNLSEA